MLKLDVLESKIKYVLGNTGNNKAVGDTAEALTILQNDAIKVCLRLLSRNGKEWKRSIYIPILLKSDVLRTT